ncbi:carbamoyl-phosphate synthase small subunit [Sporomusaceae bacterium BoRhaA]|uniref:glutamine-hydrolyzing carbamoyl-phosphate synthase small subunit n=1 Tax=Pelorhabdus rhamnosifermentans TaxID=2772457 RepID=UPI001C05FB14|nr:glutamine-hydrolyzing carbamoyl-phosphate synthase small subunit [Pelorhabdus rhamnosifermentans]MBU2702456.1 carbamoyl-phosphate synthase small subunit [Pelorhabdus rhamnosifermentans]
MIGKLILEDGTVFVGKTLGQAETVGEVVFNTGMVGYQEILTDPSYCGQIVTMTYPIIGNYGVADLFNQSRKSYVRGFIISELCEQPNSYLAEESLKQFLLSQNIPVIYGIDTRAVTRKIRAAGTMKGIIVSGNISDAKCKELLLTQLPCNEVAQVTTETVYTLPGEGPKVVVVDYGIKRNILRSLQKAGCSLTVVPANTSAEEILSYEPQGIFLSNGPGDPQSLPEAIAEVQKLVKVKPVFGICLGHQLLALALGADTYKLKFGHRGCNHPVKDLVSGRVYITSQNHGYAVDPDSLAGTDLVITHRAVNDKTVEGLKHKTLPVFSVQYHPEAAPGPDENTYLFGEFMQLLAGRN